MPTTPEVEHTDLGIRRGASLRAHLITQGLLRSGRTQSLLPIYIPPRYRVLRTNEATAREVARVLRHPELEDEITNPWVAEMYRRQR